MRLYHRTTAGRAVLIAAEGFQDGQPRDPEQWPGVWFAPDAPMDGAAWEMLAPAILFLEIPDDVAGEYEMNRASGPAWYRTWREFLIPAAVINQYPVERVDELAAFLADHPPWCPCNHPGR
jgi:hypothetical protein